MKKLPRDTNDTLIVRPSQMNQLSPALYLPLEPRYELPSTRVNVDELLVGIWATQLNQFGGITCHGNGTCVGTTGHETITHVQVMFMLSGPLVVHGGVQGYFSKVDWSVVVTLA